MPTNNREQCLSELFSLLQYRVVSLEGCGEAQLERSDSRLPASLLIAEDRSDEQRQQPVRTLTVIGSWAAAELRSHRS
jgi:hypothetical protein